VSRSKSDETAHLISQLEEDARPVAREGVLLDACLRLARFQGRHKELLTYLFKSGCTRQAYVDEVGAEIDEVAPARETGPEKTLRKIIFRTLTNAFSPFGQKQGKTELQVRIHFCPRDRLDRKIPFWSNAEL